MSQTNGTGSSHEIQSALIDGFESVWDLGANFIVGWRPANNGIVLFHLPCHALSNVAVRHSNLLTGDRRVNSDEKLEILVKNGCSSTDVELPGANADDDTLIQEINDTLRRYSVSHSECRAVALFDVVNFSVRATFDQIAQINFLAYCINLAAAHLNGKGFPIDVRTSTTGDGFYLWNRNEGFLADQSIYLVTALALTACNSAHDTLGPSRGIPDLRCCIGFGNHFEYSQARGLAADAREYIVGEVTIDLARLISLALPRQVLIGNYVRALGEDDAQLREALGMDAVDTPTFVALSQGLADRVQGAALPGGAVVSSANAYLTGATVSENEYTIKKYSVADKHGLNHRCFNFKFNVIDDRGRNVWTGVQDSDLKDFKARHLDDEDIHIRIA